MVNTILLPVLQSIHDYPDRNAFFIEGKSYSYRQLGEEIVSLRRIIQATRSEDQIWGLAIHDDLITYASIFALWLEGRAYVPLHPNQPIDRNLSIIEQVGLHHVLDSKSVSAFDILSRTFVLHFTCQEKSVLQDLDVTTLTQWHSVTDNNLAYILFTSGSTGIPKGVQITRHNLASFLESFWKTDITITPEDRCLQAFDLTFDVSVQSFLVALTRGACVYTVPYGRVKYLYVASLIQEQHITFGAMAPSMLTYLRPYFDEFDASSMHTCILTAEACPVDLLDAWYNCAGNVEIYDFYGPTEATIYCTFYKLTRGGDNLSFNGIISIGKPLSNVQAIIIREDGSLVDGDEKGELCVSGDQITPGYWNAPQKNESSFFVHNGYRYYHTGDLCFWDSSGNIMYSGRIDQQAKIQGFRVELGEIEYHARLFYSNNCRVVAIAFQNDQNLTEIAMFVESQSGNTKTLIEYLRGKLPHYMIPSRILFIPSFPLNKSDKVDRSALKQFIC